MEQARAVAGLMQSLRLRPLLLSYIDDFFTKEGRVAVDFTNQYAVHYRLVDEWLRRDARKPLGLDVTESWQVAMRLALHFARRGVRRMHRDELLAEPGLRAVPDFKIVSRSLVNRVSGSLFQFAHNTIPESARTCDPG